MRILALILFFGLVITSCVKKPSTSPVPAIEFLDFQAWKVNGSDTGFIRIHYEDGDGDIFRNKDHTVPNLIIITYHLDQTSGSFVQDSVVPGPGLKKIPISYATAVIQPGDGYSGKSVQGDIIVPYKEFRTSGAIKIIKHTVTITDEAGNQSNLVTSPVYTLTI